MIKNRDSAVYNYLMDGSMKVYGKTGIRMGQGSTGTGKESGRRGFGRKEGT